jgi:glycerol-3-phosphate dehydrogenase (NAD(P)+)
MLVGVVGGGAWGVALAKAATRTGADVVLYSRRGAPDMSHEHAGGGRITASQSYREVAEARLLVLAAPSDVVRTVARSLGDHLDGGHLVVHGVRGLAPDELCTISDIVREETPVRRLGALGGPVQADELDRGLASAIIVGSRFGEVTSAVKKAFHSKSLRVYTTPDLRGLEWASALVGVLSIGVGFAKEAGAGPGLVAALVSQGVDEAGRIVAAAGADATTMFGLAGYGDLLASMALADRPEVVVGRALARGRPLDEAVAEAKLRVEAIELLPRLHAFAREKDIAAPGVDALVRLLQGARPEAILARLLVG